MSYRIALEKLKAYEHGSLIRGRYKGDGGCCVIGVLCPETHGMARNIRSLATEDLNVWTSLARVGLTLDEAMALQTTNDLYTEGSDRGRYVEVLCWLEREVIKEIVS